MSIYERLSLEAAAPNTLSACEHIHLYEVVAELCEGQRVLDLCCGTGYGSQIILGRAASVHGVDVHVGSIEAALARSSSEANLTFEAADAATYVLGAERTTFDAVVCLGGIEQVQEPEGFIDGLGRLAAKGTTLVLSVPNDEVAGGLSSSHRATMFGVDKVYELAARFEQTEVLRQYAAEGSLILGDRMAPEGSRVVLSERAELEYANSYLLLVNVPEDRVPPALGGRGILTLAPVLNRHMRGLELANAELRRENARLAWDAFSSGGSGASSRIARLIDAARNAEQRAVEAEGRATEVEARLAAADQRTDELERRAAEAEAQTAPRRLRRRTT